MWRRWSRRVLWAAVLVILVVAPARIAHSPERAQVYAAARADGPIGSTGPSEVVWVVAGLVILTVPLLVILRRRSHRV